MTTKTSEKQKKEKRYTLGQYVERFAPEFKDEAGSGKDRLVRHFREEMRRLVRHRKSILLGR